MTRFVAVMLCVAAMATLGAESVPSEPPRIEGTKVATEAQAKDLAFESYLKKMNSKVLATELVHGIQVITLGYDAPDFAGKGERLWEAHVMTLNQELRAIIWVNPRTEAVRFLCGPWESKVDK